MKKFVFFFSAVLLLILLASCPSEIEPKTDVLKDDNGHITQITYYTKEGNVYKTEYFQFLNKKTNNNAIIKIVQTPTTSEPDNIILKRYDKFEDDNGNTVYEIRECWKIAYALECNTYIADNGLNSTLTKYNEILSNETMKTNGYTYEGIYDIENQTELVHGDSFPLKNYDFEKNQYNDSASGAGQNLATYKLIVSD